MTNDLSFTIDLSALTAAEKALPQYSQIMGREAKAAMHESVQYLRTIAISKAREKKLVNTGAYVGGFQVNVTGRTVDDLVGKVRNVSGHGIYVEYGRAPGKMPPYEPIASWVLRKLGISDDAQLAKVTFLIRRAIARRGTIARFRKGSTGPAGGKVFAETVDDGRRKVLAIFRAATARALTEVGKRMASKTGSSK